MKYRLFIFFILMLPFTHLYSQKSINKIEVKLFGRLEWYPKFSYNIGRVSTDYLKMQGRNWGFNINYRYFLKKDILLKGGAGYYKFSFKNLDNFNSQFGSSDARSIIYPSFNNLGYYTDYYHYNNIAVNIGAEKAISLKNNLFLLTGIELNNYFTVSQTYHISYEGTPQYKKTSGRLFGHGAALNISLLKQFEKMQIGPLFILPVFDAWKKDNVFHYEKQSEYRIKWLNGVGFGITCSF